MWNCRGEKSQELLHVREIRKKWKVKTLVIGALRIVPKELGRHLDKTRDLVFVELQTYINLYFILDFE